MKKIFSLFLLFFVFSPFLSVFASNSYPSYVIDDEIKTVILENGNNPSYVLDYAESKNYLVFYNDLESNYTDDSYAYFFYTPSTRTVPFSSTFYVKDCYQYSYYKGRLLDVGLKDCYFFDGSDLLDTVLSSFNLSYKGVPVPMPFINPLGSSSESFDFDTLVNSVNYQTNLIYVFIVLFLFIFIIWFYYKILKIFI